MISHDVANFLLINFHMLLTPKHKSHAEFVHLALDGLAHFLFALIIDS